LENIFHESEGYEVKTKIVQILGGIPAVTTLDAPFGFDLSG
jgi:hypothetical protein